MRANLGEALARQAEQFLEHLLGPPAQRHAREWRYGRRGSLSCMLAGEKRGLYFDHEAGEGGDLVQLAARVTGVTLADAARAARDWLGPKRDMPRPERATPAVKAPRRSEGALHLAIAIWNECIPARGTLVERYLEARGLKLPDAQDIRFHPRLMHAPTRTERPAMVALMRDIKTNAPTGIHRTYLSDDGASKADIAPVKMMLGRSSGACVKLAPDDEVTMGLTVAEGIETALAAMQMQRGSIAWAMLSASGLRHFPVLAGIECLTVCADNDETGTAAARECALRWRKGGCEVRLRTPGAFEADWADVAQNRVRPEARA